jgi:glutaredoxin
MWKYLDPRDELQSDVVVSTRERRPSSVRAKRLLRNASIEFEKLLLNGDYSNQTIRAVAAVISYSRVFINGGHIFGSDELVSWNLTSPVPVFNAQ